MLLWRCKVVTFKPRCGRAVGAGAAAVLRRMPKDATFKPGFWKYIFLAGQCDFQAKPLSKGRRETPQLKPAPPRLQGTEPKSEYISTCPGARCPNAADPG